MSAAAKSAARPAAAKSPLPSCSRPCRAAASPRAVPAAAADRYSAAAMVSLTADEFVTAFARHGRALWLLAAAWVGRSEAQDLIQEAARVAWQRRGQFAAGTDIAAWLAQIVRLTGANWRRQKRPTCVDPGDVAEPIARGELPVVATFAQLRDQLPDELASALASLPEVARACLLLHVVAEMSFAEIATMLELPENTAMSHARRARLALRAALPAPAPATQLTPMPETP
jgi:RNA polymerase sigma factor (sigma-70 family)